jgi:glutamate--cysteine ligase
MQTQAQAAASGPYARPIRSKAELLAPFERSQKPRRDWRVGVETEKFGFIIPSASPIAYAGVVGITGVMEELSKRFGWVPESEHVGGPVIALRRGQSSVTVEPGGQLELGGAPLPNLHEMRTELRQYLTELGSVSHPLDVKWASVGFNPIARRDQLPWVPKSRYAIMREYLPSRGSGALDMMQRTATIQVNFDYDSERDALRKMRILLRLAPIVQAMTAHAPLAEKQIMPWQSMRGDVWLRMDPARSGLIESLWSAPNPSYETYVEWALDAGMFLFKRGNQVVANTGQTFRSFLADGFQGHRATLADWVLHLNTLFPEVRLRHTIEVRCCDAQPMDTLLAVPAIFTGITYDDLALDAADRLTNTLTFAAVQAARPALVRDGLEAMLGGQPVRRWAEQLLTIAGEGLARRGRFDAGNISEQHYLEPLVRLIDSGHTPALRLRQNLENMPDVTPLDLINATAVTAELGS